MAKYKVGQKIILEFNDETFYGIISTVTELGFVVKGDNGLFYPWMVINDKAYPLLKDDDGNLLTEKDLVEKVEPIEVMIQ